MTKTVDSIWLKAPHTPGKPLTRQLERRRRLLDVCSFLAATYGSAVNSLVVMCEQSELYQDALEAMKAEAENDA